jgi:hypothetical protein
MTPDTEYLLAACTHVTALAWAANRAIRPYGGATPEFSPGAVLQPLLALAWAYMKYMRVLLGYYG